ncbi:hypothetical protein AK812_SmicGene23950 [Symbiodinium microadriaticum]|uniref:Uncharacterized protein n=1 Tax=Symbiodinium microadriaticum TaxID=2951 RepID=A0A1Q9DFV5_SYMMI|nr:hypothetical protein AK812_SmicGene23950 [Symbiodinium microadriaticum]
MKEYWKGFATSWAPSNLNRSILFDELQWPKTSVGPQGGGDDQLKHLFRVGRGNASCFRCRFADVMVTGCLHTLGVRRRSKTPGVMTTLREVMEGAKAQLETQEQEEAKKYEQAEAATESGTTRTFLPSWRGI